VAVKLDVLNFLNLMIYTDLRINGEVIFFLNFCQFAWLFCDVIQQIVIFMFILFLKCTFPLRHISDRGNASVHTGKVHSKCVVLC